MKVAKLVLWSPIVRIVIDSDASYEHIIAVAKSKFYEVLRDEYEENIEEVIDDLECPYEEEEGKPPVDLIVGDKYKVIERMHGHEFEIGEIITLVERTDDGGIYKGKASSRFPGISEWHLCDEEVEKI